jgi:sugar O-acyltransferase (sialic acid O-acetyltransferase NeuD family)
VAGLILIAASGLAREVLATPEILERYDDRVVVDDDPARWGAVCGDAKVLGGLDLVHELPLHEVLLCTGQGRVRRALEQRLLAAGLAPSRFTSVVHPRAAIGTGCRVGAGSIVLAGVTLTADVTVGRHVVVMPGVTLTHDDVVGDYATLCAGVTLGGDVRVGEAAYLGMNASIREGVRIGRGSVLGMGAALLTHLPEGQTWAGVPARPLGSRSTS